MTISNDIRDIKEVWNVRHNRTYYISNRKMTLGEEIDAYKKVLTYGSKEKVLHVRAEDLERLVGTMSILKVPNNIFEVMREFEVTKRLNREYESEVNKWNKVIKAIEEEEQTEKAKKERYARLQRVLEKHLKTLLEEVTSDKYAYIWSTSITYATPIEAKSQLLKDIKVQSRIATRYQAITRIWANVYIDAM